MRECWVTPEAAKQNEAEERKRKAPRVSTGDDFRESLCGWLCFGVEQKDQWKIPDPEYQPLRDAMWRCRYTPEDVSRADLFLLAQVAEAYVYLTTSALGIEHAIHKLRAVWRALR